MAGLGSSVVGIGGTTTGDGVGAGPALQQQMDQVLVLTAQM